MSDYVYVDDGTGSKTSEFRKTCNCCKKECDQVFWPDGVSPSCYYKEFDHGS